MPLQVDKTASKKIGFIAFYNGKNIASAGDLKDTLKARRRMVTC